jgi:thiosulfate reductase cytochrome b subunit
METRIYLYPGWLRLWHAINGLLCLLLIITGISMQYSGTGSFLMRFDLAVQVHNVCGIILSLNYLIYLIGNRVTPNGRQYWLYRPGLPKNLIKQMRYYLFGIFKHEETPFPQTLENKFNPLQRLTYFIVAYIMLIIVIVTGWAYLFPEIVPNEAFGISGLLVNDLIHITAGFIISIFLVIHVYFCTIGNKNNKNFKSIVTGWHE